MSRHVAPGVVRAAGIVLALGAWGAATGQEVSTGSASSLQGLRIKSPLTCNDGFVITWVAANSRFECLAGGAGGGSSAFPAITGGTNTSAAMVLGSGASLTVSGTGTNNATHLGGNAANTYAPLASPMFTGSVSIGTAATVDAATGNISTQGSVTSGSGSGVAGADIFFQGTAPSIVANAITHHAPTAVTGYRLVEPSAAGNGLKTYTNSANVVTEAFLAGTSTTVLHGNSSGSPTYGSVVNADIAANAVDSSKLALVNTRRVCSMVIGAENGSALADADIGPQGNQCFIPYAATVVEIDVQADAGTPSVIPRIRHCSTYTANVCSAWTTSDLTFSALAAATGGFPACSKTTATTGLDGGTTCSATLQNTSIAIGDWIELKSGTAGGTAKRLSVDVIYTVN